MTERKQVNPVLLRLDKSAFDEAISELNVYVAELPLELLKLPVGFFDTPSKLFRLEHSPASVGADVTILLKPSDLFLDWLAARRAINR